MIRFVDPDGSEPPTLRPRSIEDPTWCGAVRLLHRFGAYPAMARATTHLQYPESVDVGDGRRIDLYEQLGKGQCSTVYRAVLESTTGIKRAVAFKLYAAVA